MTLTMTPADLLDLPVENDPMSPRSDQPERRSFTAQYKRDVLVEYDAATTAGRGAILRRERLYSSHLTEWRKARDNGALAGLTPSVKSSTKTTEKVEKAQWQARARGPNGNWPGRRWPWRSWEKHTRWWRCSPRARTPNHRRHGDQRSDRSTGRADQHQHGVRSARQTPGQSLPRPPTRHNSGGAAAGGPQRGLYYECYVILDIYSRYVVGWTVAAREDSRIAKELIAHAITLHGAPASLHADNGTSMTSKPVAQLLVDLGVARRHSGIALHTPASVHFGTAAEICEQRQVTLQAAFDANPARFRPRQPQAPTPPDAPWINQPSRQALIHNTQTPSVSTDLTRSASAANHSRCPVNGSTLRRPRPATPAPRTSTQVVRRSPGSAPPQRGQIGLTHSRRTGRRRGRSSRPFRQHRVRLWAGTRPTRRPGRATAERRTTRNARRQWPAPCHPHGHRRCAIPGPRPRGPPAPRTPRTVA